MFRPDPVPVEVAFGVGDGVAGGGSGDGAAEGVSDRGAINNDGSP